MDENVVIEDGEILYRSIRGDLDADEYRYNDSGKLIILRKAFSDRTKEPSVDRAKLRNFTPSLSKKDPTQGVVSLVSKEVRAIGTVITKIENEEVEQHCVDVIYDPVTEAPPNLAHSKVTAEPKFFGSEGKQKKAFKLLRISLARLATQSGWTLRPTKNISHILTPQNHPV